MLGRREYGINFLEGRDAVRLAGVGVMVMRHAHEVVKGNGLLVVSRAAARYRLDDALEAGAVRRLVREDFDAVDRDRGWPARVRPRPGSQRKGRRPSRPETG